MNDDPGLSMLNDEEETAPEKGREPENDSMTEALSTLPDVVVRRISTIAARYGIRHDSDPMWALVEAVQGGMECAQAAALACDATGKISLEVKAGIAKIPDQIFNGATRASDEVKGGLVAGAKLFVEAFAAAANTRQAALLAAADTGSDKIRDAAKTLTSSLDKAIEAKKGEGISEFAKAASNASLNAAKSASYASFRLSAAILALVMVLGGVGGAGGEYAYLQLTHQAPISDVTDFPVPGGTLLVLPDNVTASSPGECPTGGKCVTIPTLPTPAS